MKNNVLMLLMTIALLTGCASTLKRPPLQDAIAKNDIALVRQLLDKGANINGIKGEVWAPPLGEAAAWGHTEIVNLLLQRGADLDNPGQIGRTALIWAIANKQAAIAKLLIEKGASVNQEDQTGMTPLNFAAQTGQVEIIKLLMEKGAKVNARNAAGVTPLHWGNAEVASVLLDNGADINNRSTENQVTPLMDAAANGVPAKIELLLAKGAPIDAMNRFNSTPLHFSASHTNAETARTLVNKGANVNAINTDGQTPLMMVIPVVSYGITPGTPAAQEFTTKKSTLIKLLLDNGADISVRDKTGKTAMDYARAMAKDYGNDTYVKMLLAAPKAPPKVAIAPTPAKPAQLTPQQLAELDTLVAGKNIPALKAFLDNNPVALAAIKDNDLRLQLTGPAELRIVDIAALVSAKKKDTLIIAQINSSGGPYKKFSLAEMEALQKLGISDEVIAAMITVTTEYNKQQKRQPAPQAAQPVPEAPPVQSYQQVEPQAQQQDAQSNECVQLALAIKACDKGSGFIPLVGGLAAEGCKAAARSKFSCSLPIEQFM